MSLQAQITVGPLAAGGTVTKSHGLTAAGAAIAPNVVKPTKATAIVVTAVTSTTVSFRNDGKVTETADFTCQKDHSVQSDGSVEHLWQGGGLGQAQLRVADIDITGVTDMTQVKVAMVNRFNAEALAQETLDSDTPTGGTNFDISADGHTLTIKGLTKAPVQTLWWMLHEHLAGAALIAHAEVSGSDILIQLHNAVTGADYDMTSLANGVLIEVTAE